MSIKEEQLRHRARIRRNQDESQMSQRNEFHNLDNLGLPASISAPWTLLVRESYSPSRVRG